LHVVDAGHLSTRDCFSFRARQALVELRDCGALFGVVTIDLGKIERFWSALMSMCATSSVGLARLGEGAF
jgi:hypothetical protein